MDDMEKKIITLMKVTNRIICHAMVGAVLRQTKIKKMLKKMGKSEDKKD